MTEVVTKLDLTRVSPGHTVEPDGRTLRNLPDDRDHHDLGSPATAGCDFGTGDFTIELWLKNKDTGWNDRWRCLLGNLSTSDNESFGVFVSDPSYNANGITGGVLAVWADGSAPDVGGTTDITGGDAHHAVVCRHNGTLRIFVDGVMELKTTWAHNIAGTGNFKLGASNDGSDDDWVGDIDEVRVTKAARYTSDASFSVPIYPYPRATNVEPMSLDAGAVYVTGQPVELLTVMERTVTADPGSFVVAGQDARVLRGQFVDVDAGAATLIGQPAGKYIERRLPGDDGGLTVTAPDAQVGRVLTLSAAAGSFTTTGQPARKHIERLLQPVNKVLLVSVKPAALTTSFDRSFLANSSTVLVSGDDTGLRADRHLSPAAGSVTASGYPTTRLRGRTIKAAAGTVSWTGQTADLNQLAAYYLYVDPGSLSVTGQPVDARVDHALSAAVGTVSVSGQTAGVGRELVISASPASLSVTGHPVEAATVRTLGAANAAVLVSGKQVAFSTSVRFDLLASNVTMLVLGQSVQPRVDRLLTAAGAGLGLNGQAVQTHVTRTLTAAAGSVGVTTPPADLAAVVLRDLPASAGALTVTGQDVAPLADRRLPAETGSLTLAGVGAPALRGRTIQVAAGTLSHAGQTAGVLYGRLRHADAGTFTGTGQTAALLQTHRVAAVAGSVAFTGQSVQIDRLPVLNALAGAVSATGADVGLLRGYRVPGGVGAHAWTGLPSDLLRERVIIPAAGAFAPSTSVAGLRVDRFASVDVGSMTIAIPVTGLQVSFLLPAGAQGFTSTGKSVGISRERRLLTEVEGVELVSWSPVLYYGEITLSGRRTVVVGKSRQNLAGGVISAPLVGGRIAGN